MSAREEYFHIGLLFALCVVVFFVGLGIQDIWDIDEGMHAAMAQNMVISGDWVTPVFNGVAFFDKPALFNWSNAIAFVLFGVTESAARMPSAIAGFGCVVLTYLFGRKIFDAKTGLLAGVILATSFEMMVLSRVVQYDIPFTFFTTLALYCFASGAIDESMRRRYFLAFYMAIALAFLTKGPLAIVLTGLVIGPYLLHPDRIKLLLKMQIPLGIMIFLLIVTPWFVLMEKANPGYVHYFLVQQHAANFLGGTGEYTPRHPEPFYYYLPVLLLGLLPWSLMLPQAITRAIKYRRTSKTGMILFLVMWVVFIFLFFSAATSKLGTYLLPIFPAAALLLGRYWYEFLERPTKRSRIGVLFGTGVVFALLGLFTGYVIVEKPWAYVGFRSGVVWKEFEIAMSLISALFGLAFLLTWFRKNLHLFIVFSVISPIFLFYTLFAVVPDVNAYKGSKQIAVELDRLLPPGEKFRFYGQLLDSAVFYAQRDAVVLKTEQELNEYLADENRVYVLVRSRARTEEDAFKDDYHVLKVIGNKAIVSNKPDT
ncbi:MAG: glycosyltransferase family 39 protein [Arenicellales bacterium]